MVVSRDGYWFGGEVQALVQFMGQHHWHRAADLGCGDGIIALLLARHGMAEDIWAIDIDEAHCRRTESNIRRNQLSGTIRLLQRDIRKLGNVLKKRSFDLITANPPFFPGGRDHHGLTDAQRNARQEIRGSLRFFLQAAEFLAARKADLYIIYHPSRLDELFLELAQTAFCCKELQLLFHGDGRALFVLAHCIYGGGKGLRILPPITVPASIKSEFKET